MYKQLNEFLSTVNGTENLRVICDWNAVDGEADLGTHLYSLGWAIGMKKVRDKMNSALRRVSWWQIPSPSNNYGGDTSG
jgi:hypothetical protein